MTTNPTLLPAVAELHNPRRLFLGTQPQETV